MNGTYKPLPPAAELWELYSYNPLTGNLHWRQGKKRAKKGTKAGSRSNTGYCRIRLRNVEYVAHRLIWSWLHGRDPGQLVLSHVNGDSSANQPWNLQTVSPTLPS